MFPTTHRRLANFVVEKESKPGIRSTDREMKGKYKVEVTGVVVGAVAGWCYWYFVGCASGTCPISSNPWISTAYGAVLGYLGVGAFRKQPKEKQNNK